MAAQLPGDARAIALERLAATASTHVKLPTDPAVVEGKRKFYACLEDEVLDYKHNGATQSAWR